MRNLSIFQYRFPFLRIASQQCQIRRLRCQEAAQMLKKTDLPIQEISFYVGYPDNNYFVKVFRSEYGVTPTDYRSKKGEAPVFSSVASGPSTS